MMIMKQSDANLCLQVERVKEVIPKYQYFHNGQKMLFNGSNQILF
ncbi:MAG: hypothetical protein N2249_01125 [Melioribacter sp.]|nr:hypothetical protein [Melioribacter sp.]